ncbi:mucin-3A-like [Phalacrocorax aristotelis]|uniref:mucin-3A-like n=1 Tax=Phalacrocorax aristotelis TaxID=126867 RepID=UPI003F4B2774
MREVYKHIEGYQDVVIHELNKGSIVVNYTVLLKVLASTTANETVQSISKSLVTALNSYTNCNETCQGDNCTFCFNSTYTSVDNFRVEEVETSVCDSHIPEDFKTYFSPLVTATGVLCITRCDKRSADPYPCVHGTCVVARSGPQCECSEPSAFWYQDSACSSRISKVGVAVGVPVAGLVVAVAAFTAFLLRAKRQKDEYRDKLTSHSELYCSTDESWTSPQGFTASNPAATWEDLEAPSTNCINLENVDTSQKIHIQRPSVIVP